MEMKTKIDVLVTRVRLNDYRLNFFWSKYSIISNISTTIFYRIKIIYCFSDSQSRSRFVQIEQIRRRHIKSYAAGGEKCNKKDGEEKRLCAPCESGI